MLMSHRVTPTRPWLIGTACCNIPLNERVTESDRDMGQDRFVAYYRVSTARQGSSGLGLEAQRESVSNFLGDDGDKLIAEFTEVESGKRNNRPELSKALDACRLHKATLVIAKLDRLARNVAFTSNLMESGVEFVAVDFPQANRLTIHILAAVAEHEAEAISIRTKAALAAAKTRGTKLGNPGNLTAEARARGSQMGNKTKSAKALQSASLVLPAIREAQANGATSLRQVAAALNAQGIPTPRGKEWSAAQVARTIARSAE